MYAIEAAVTRVIPWIHALPDCVALGSCSTELGEVNMCLYLYVNCELCRPERIKRQSLVLSPILELCSEKGYSRDHLDHKYTPDRQKLATDPQIQAFHHFVILPLFLKLKLSKVLIVLLVMRGLLNIEPI